MNILKKIKDRGQSVIIVGAGVVGEVLYEACKSKGIRVECFCDNNINKTSNLLKKLPIIYTPDLKNKYKDAVFLISTADIKDVVDQLKSFGYKNWYAGNSLLRDFNIYDYEYSKPVDFVVYATSTAILCHDSYLTPKKLFLKSVDTIVTEKCSLRCKDCSNLMRYYKNPQDTDLRELIKDIDKLCSIVDEINEVRVLGGEPFMYKEVHLFIKKLTDESKVKKIIIYTNGTIIPRDEQLEYLKNDKILFIITNYGEISRNLKSLVEMLTNNNIAFYVQKVGGWTDCSKIIKHNRKIDEQQELFRNCCAKNTITLSKGEIFRCPFAANAIRLHAIPNFLEDRVNIFQKDISVIKMKKLIRKYLLDKQFLKICDYCNGRSFGDPEIQPAIQQMETNEYQQYSY